MRKLSSAFKNGSARAARPPVCPPRAGARPRGRPSVHLAAPREERQNFKADKQEVCIIPLVPEEEETRQEKEREGRDGTGREREASWEAGPMFKFSPRT